MKKLAVLLIFIILNTLVVQASVDSIYEYLKKVDEDYVVVVGLKAKSSDSLAATDIIIGLKKELDINVEVTVENLISPNINKILIGHPCDNALIKLSCENWPYDAGQALVKVMDNDLVIAGSTLEDTRKAAEVIANFKMYPQLKQFKEILILGNELNPQYTILQEVKKDFVCGDTVCEPGEKLSCAIDCKNTTCFRLCTEKGFINAYCRTPPSNPTLPLCQQGETNHGFGYCAGEKVCCCEQAPQSSEPQQQDQQENIPIQEEQKKGIFRAIWEWLKEIFSVLT